MSHIRVRLPDAGPAGLAPNEFWEVAMRYATGWLIAALLGCFVLASAARAEEEKIPLDKVPKAVVDAVKKKFPDVKLDKASTEKEDGKTIYELAFTYKDSKYEVECEEDGTIVAIDKVITAKELPKEVAKTLEEKYPKATYKTIEEVTKKDKIAHYEIDLVTADKKGIEVEIDPSGKVLKEEKKKVKEEEKK
jgi:uncharacterized membrane protein YkoI